MKAPIYADEADLAGMFEALKARGYSEEKAGRYAALIGDVIETDPDGKWIIRDNADTIIDRIDPLY